MIAANESRPATVQDGGLAGRYVDHLGAQLSRLIVYVGARPAAELQPHFESFLALLRATELQPRLTASWLELVDALHPLPMRWGQWIAWLPVLRTAERQAEQLHQPARQAEYMAYMAELLLATGRLDNALEKATASMALARRVGATWPLGLAGSVAAGVLRALARFDEAQVLVESVRADLESLESPRSATNAAMMIALLDMEAMDLLRYYNRLDEAAALGRAMIERLSAVSDLDPHDLATAYRRRATLTWVRGRYGEAVDDLQRAVALFRQAGDPLQAVFTEGNLGLVYYSMSRYDQAESLKLAAIGAAEAANARQRLISDLGDMGVIYLALGENDLAADYASRMIALAEAMGNMAELSRGRGNRGYALLALGRFEEAREDIEFGLDLYRRQGRLEGTLITSVDYVTYLQGTGNESEAAALAKEIYEAAWEGDFPHLRIVTTRCLAQFQPTAEAERLLRQAMRLARKHNRPLDEAGCLFSLAAVAGDSAEREALYRQGVALLHQMGCPGWVEGRSAADPPLLPMII